MRVGAERHIAGMTHKIMAVENFLDIIHGGFDLVQRRRRDIRGRHIDHQDIIRIDDLIINKTDQKVFRAGIEIALTLKEFQLLVYLAEAQGRTVSKQQITENVWEHNFNTNTNTVEVYINFLRKKLDKDFKVKLIHTRSGFGYYLNPL